jgi:transposase
MLIRRRRTGKSVVFAEPPWPEDSPPWQELDEELDANHLARVVVERVRALDLSDLTRSYSGAGSRPYRPDLMLCIALIEIQRGRHSPSHWFADNQENKALQWAGLGIQPSRTCWHEFYDRVAPFLLDLGRQVLRQAQQQGQITGARAALDGSLVGANASRHRLLNADRLDKRLNQLQTRIAGDEATSLAPAPPAVGPEPRPQTPKPDPDWMARTPDGRQAPYQR